MIPVADKPILLWQIEWIKRYGVDEVILCISHLRERIVEYFGDGERVGVRVSYVVETEPLGTGGALRNALPHFPKDEPFFAFNGDVISDIDLTQVRDLCKTQGAVGALTLVPLPSPYGIVETDDTGHVRAFVEKPRLTDRWINAGIYCLQPSIASYLPERGSLELDVFPVLAQEGKLLAHKSPEGYWTSIDSPKDIEEATRSLRERPGGAWRHSAEGSST